MSELWKQDINPLDRDAMALASARWDNLIKPKKGLGSLESFVTRLAGIQGKSIPTLNNRRAIIFVAEHGVADERVSAYPPNMTSAIVEAFLTGHSGTAVLCRETDTEITVVDVGLRKDWHRSGILNRKLSYGTKNFLYSPAMSRSEAEAALNIGAKIIEESVNEKIDGIALGEIGIGNTTACSAMTACFLGLNAEEVVGRGSGVANDAMKRKIDVVKGAVAKHQPDPDDPIEVLCALGGLEIAALTGAILASARLQIPTVLDGFVTATAALTASRINPAIADYLLVSHRSREIGQQKILEHLDLQPLLAFDLQYGEGVGAVLGLHQAYLTCCLLRDMGIWQKDV